MKRICLVCALLTLCAQGFAGEAKTNFFGFTKFNLEQGTGTSSDSDITTNPKDNGVKFAADDVQLGYNFAKGDLSAVVVADFMNTNKATEGVMPAIFTVAFMDYKVCDHITARLGMPYSPVGMDDGIKTQNIDLTKRGMDQSLVLGRVEGISFLGKDIAGGWGYYVGAYNPARKSPAVTTASRSGDGNTYAGRLSYQGKEYFLMGAYGVNEAAGGISTRDYKVLNFAGKIDYRRMTVKLEYVKGENIQGEENWTESTWYAHVSYRFNETFVAMLRQYHTKGKKNAVSRDLSNTYVGLNVNVNKNTRLRFNYIMADGDRKNWNEQEFLTAGRYLGNAAIAQAQFHF